VDRDDGLRAAAFLALDALRARMGEDLPIRGGLDQGFVWDGRRVPFLNWQKGIFRAGVQSGPAALSIMTSIRSPYDDHEASDGFWYAYRSGGIDQPDNRALRAAFELQAPLVYYVATRPGVYRAEYPCYVAEDDPYGRRVLVAVGARRQADLEPVVIDDPVERRYRTHEVRVRLHQARFRGLVLGAYRDRCTICRLRESRLLDAAHIVPDADPHGDAEVSNGLSLCTIHHRAFDQNLVGVDPGYQVHVARRLLEEEDGPMLELMKGFHGGTIEFPRQTRLRPDRDRLAARFDSFRRA
jgi:putative restriction endonuclease